MVIGAGIFTVTASTAGDITGPAISISFVIAAVTCGLAALCYAEFASTVPVAGSAYTFSYATFGELIAWIIGWDLMLEFAIGAAVVAKGWSTYLGTVFGFAGGTVEVRIGRARLGRAADRRDRATLIALGTKLSSRFSAVITAIKVAVVLLGHRRRRLLHQDRQLLAVHPAAGGRSAAARGIDQSVFSLLTGADGSHYGWYGVLAGASIVFFAFIGFDIVATTAEETKNPAARRAAGILASLAIVTVLYVAVVRRAVRHGALHRAARPVPDGAQANLATAFTANGIDWAAKIISIGALAGLTTVVMVLMLGQCRVLFAMARDGLLPRRLAKTGSHGTPVRITVLVARAGGRDGVGVPDRQARGDGQRRHAVRVRPGLGRRDRAAPDPARPAARLPGAVGAGAADRLDRCACLWLMLNLTALDLDPVRGLDGGRHRDLPRLRRPPLGAGRAGAEEADKEPRLGSERRRRVGRAPRAFSVTAASVVQGAEIDLGPIHATPGYTGVLKTTTTSNTHRSFTNSSLCLDRDANDGSQPQRGVTHKEVWHMTDISRKRNLETEVPATSGATRSATCG